LSADSNPTADVILATSLGLSWRTEGIVPAKDVVFQPAMAAGLVALDQSLSGFRFAITPTEAVLRASVTDALRDRQDVVVMPVAAFRTMLRDHARDEILATASHGLEHQRPGESAAAGLSLGQKLTGCLVAAALIWSLVSQPQVALIILAILTLPIFAVLLVLRIGAVIDGWEPDPVPVLPIPDHKLPVYTVLVPLYREAAVLDQLLTALLALDYPPTRLDIKILVEDSDQLTRDALSNTGLPAHIDVIVAPRGVPQTKPRALNIGLMEARGELLTIYDAEDRPDPRQLRLSANLFARHKADVACLQGRLVIDNADDTLLTRMFALEYAALFDVINIGLIRAGVPVLLGGTSNHFRTGILREVGGWDAFNVTEDADLSFRLLRAGFAIRDLPSATLEEAPAAFGPWLNQRIRWMKGFLQTLITHTREPRKLVGDLGLKNAMVLLSLCGGTLLSALCYPLFLLATGITLAIYGLPSADTLAEAALIGVWITMFGGGVLALVLPVMLGASHRGISDLLWFTPVLPLYFLLVSAAAFLALVEYVRAPSQWNKTEHGLAKTSRLLRTHGPSRPAA
jgi:glycosyltransferase XagB